MFQSGCNFSVGGKCTCISSNSSIINCDGLHGRNGCYYWCARGVDFKSDSPCNFSIEGICKDFKYRGNNIQCNGRTDRNRCPNWCTRGAGF